MGREKASLLTDKQRKYLRGEKNPSNESQTKGRMRDRIYHGLRNDGTILLRHLEPEERRKIFRNWENQRYDSIPQEIDYSPNKDQFEKYTFKSGIQNLLGFIYLGVEEGNLGDFDEILKEGIDKAVRKRGNYVKNLNLNIEFEELATLDDIHKRLKDGSLEYGELTVKELQGLIETGRVHRSDLPANIRQMVENIENSEE